MRALPLRAYKALTRRAGAAHGEDRPARPDGPLLWGIISHEDHARALMCLVDRIGQMRGEPCTLLVTGLNLPRAKGKLPALYDTQPADVAAACEDFLAHWQPDVGIWLGAELQPVLLDKAHHSKVPLVLQGAQISQFQTATLRWLPGLSKDVLACFDAMTAEDAETARHIRRQLSLKRNVPITAPLQISSPALPVTQEQLEDLSEMLSGRPVWMAVGAHSSELPDILVAHRASVRLTHRLLLVLTCANAQEAVQMRAALQKQDWRVCIWDDGDLIEETTQIVLVEEDPDMGLWYRAAPVSFLASSLANGLGGQDPYLACALGSAVIYGPNVRAHLSSYTRLAGAGAARIVRDADGLARALAHLLAADQAASMAHSAWQIISDGAEATDDLAGKVIDLLDTRVHERLGSP